jgi:electron transport complex protein RnfG
MASNSGRLLPTLILIGTVAAAAGLLVSTTYDWSHERIMANQRARLVARLNSVLDPALRGRDLAMVRISRTDRDLLGSDLPVDVFVLREANRPVAAVFASIAPHGYNAPIALLVGISPDGVVTGVRAVTHRETPGLGDQIDAAESDWILQFDGKSLLQPPPEAWAVDKDEGQLDAITGATVTSRAVVAAVKNALLYFSQHRDDIYTEAASAASLDDVFQP